MGTTDGPRGTAQNPPGPGCEAPNTALARWFIHYFCAMEALRAVPIPGGTEAEP